MAARGSDDNLGCKALCPCIEEIEKPLVKHVSVATTRLSLRPIPFAIDSMFSFCSNDTRESRGECIGSFDWMRRPLLLEVAVDEAIATCGGGVRAASHVLLARTRTWRPKSND